MIMVDWISVGIGAGVVVALQFCFYCCCGCRFCKKS